MRRYCTRPRRRNVYESDCAYTDVRVRVGVVVSSSLVVAGTWVQFPHPDLPFSGVFPGFHAKRRRAMWSAKSARSFIQKLGERLCGVVAWYTRVGRRNDSEPRRSQTNSSRRGSCPTTSRTTLFPGSTGRSRYGPWRRSFNTAKVEFEPTEARNEPDGI